ncbi:MAG: MATE family efflux transporter [Faecalibacterium sp.]|nr:MATE family efflux transporter [Faecalibacterium sp.]
MQFVNVERALGNTPRCGEIPSQLSLVKRVVQVAWPSVLEMLLMSVGGIVDTAMVSGLGEEAIAAVGLTTQPKFIGLCFFFSMGTAVSALVARRRGEGNEESATQVLRMALIVAFFGALVVGALFVVFARPICLFAGAAPDTIDNAATYLRIIMGGMVFTVITFTINAAQKGCGNTRLSMKTNITANLVNLVGNYLLIEGHFGFPRLEVAGAAIATVFGTMVGCCMSIASLFSKKTFVRAKKVVDPKFGGWLDKRNVRSMLDVGSSAFVEQIFMRIGFFAFSLIVAKLGTLEMAAHIVGMNIMTISFSIGDGMQTASISLSGRSLGQNRPDLARLYATTCQRIGLVCAAVLSVVLFTFSRQIFTFFSDDPLVLNYGVQIIRVLCLVLFFQVPQLIYGGALRSAGDTKYTAMVSLISVTIVRAGLGWLFCYPLGLGLIGAWIGILLQTMIGFTLFRLRFNKGEWTKIRI